MPGTPVRVVVIDNYDSFTYNLVQALGTLGAELTVARNDAIDVAGVRELAPDLLVLSPGPGRPSEAGVTREVIAELMGEVAIFGVCLGHQAICEVLGGRVVAAPEIVHGKPSLVEHVGTGIYEGLSMPFEAARYHSLVAERASLPASLELVAWSGEVVMGVRHRELALEGVQFHPESVLTTQGPRLLANLLDQATTRSRV